MEQLQSLSMTGHSPRRASGGAWRGLLAVALLSACSKADPADPTDEGAAASGGEGGAGGAGASGGDGGGGDGLFGSFTVGFFPPQTGNPAYTAVRGSIYDGRHPVRVGMVTVLEEGACKLIKGEIPFCDPPCVDGKECSEGDVCVANPTALDVGTVAVAGLGAEVQMKAATTPGRVYQSPTLAYPACEAGGAISLKAEGFLLEGACLDLLTLPTADAVKVQSGEAAEVLWDPPSSEDLASVSILLDVAPHGGTGAQVRCEAPDTGEFEIPASIVTALVDLGLSGFPSIALTRFMHAAAKTEPDVRLSVESSVLHAVDTGVTSCESDEQCPPGQICDLDHAACTDARPDRSH